MNAHPRHSISLHSRSIGQHDPLILSYDVVEAVEHPAGLIQVPDENIVTVRNNEPFDFRLWYLGLVEPRAVTDGDGAGPTGPPVK